MSVLILDDHRCRFRSDADYIAFVSVLKDAVDGSKEIQLFARGTQNSASEHVVTLISPANAKSRAQERLAREIDVEAQDRLDAELIELEKRDRKDMAQLGLLHSLLSNPSLLDELSEQLECDDPVE